MSKKALPQPQVRKYCEKEGCKKFFVATLQKAVQAWRDGWFVSKYDGPAWCSDDIPDWAPAQKRRMKKKSKGT